MTPVQRKRIVDSQRNAWMQHGYHPNSLFWSNKEIQFLRFEVLLELGISDNSSILDIGCGFGDFSRYITDQGKSIHYTGIDLSAELITEGKHHYPDCTFIEADLFELDPLKSSYDYVFLSGTLNRQFDDKGDYAYKTISKMYDTCRKGVAFNLLDARHEWTASRWDLQSFLPDDVMEFARGLSPNVKLRDGYLDNDFTIFIYRDLCTKDMTDKKGLNFPNFV